MRFVPVDLDLDAKLVALRHKSLATPETLLLLPPLYILANCPLGCRASRHLKMYPFPDALRRVPLLARRLAIGFQNRVDECRRRSNLQMRAFGLLAPRRQRTSNCLSNCATMHTQLPRHTDNRTRPKLILPANLLVKLHLGSPVQLPPPS